MKIGQLSKLTGSKIETIRYYESIGLLPVTHRSDSGYRIYQESHVRRLSFIRKSRELGFSIKELKVLLDLVDSDNYTCCDVKEITMEHLEKVRQKIADLRKLEKTLSKIAAQCAGDATPDCPIIDALYE